MKSLDLNVEQSFAIDRTTLLFLNERCKTSLVGQFTVIECLLEGLVGSEFLEVLELGSIANPTVANLRGDERRQVRVALQEPSSESDLPHERD